MKTPAGCLCSAQTQPEGRVLLTYTYVHIRRFAKLSQYLDTSVGLDVGWTLDGWMRRLGGVVGSSHVAGRGAFALATRQRERRLALGLREAAGELREGLHEGGALGHAHLPQLHLLHPSPLLRLLHLYLPALAQVRLVAQDDDRHLEGVEEEQEEEEEETVTGYVSSKKKNPVSFVNQLINFSLLSVESEGKKR